jgi:DNA-binding HxlR family transcriptional regulator
MQPATLIALFHHRWSVEILDHLLRQNGASLTALVQSTGGSRGAAREAVAALVRTGWVARVEGHGHPLRPEYVLTASGSGVARCASRLSAALRESGLPEISRHKWLVPVLWALATGSTRFTAIQQRLPGLTGRALSLALQRLESTQLVQRSVVNGTPPRSHYGTTAEAGTVLPAIRRLTRCKATG